MPPLPSWSSLHPLVVHFPIALLTVTPLLVLVGLAHRRTRGFLSAAFLVMALGTAAAWLAVATGESAAQLVDRLPGVEPLLLRHEQMADTVRVLFTILTLLYAGLLTLPRALRRDPGTAARWVSYGAWMGAYGGALIYLVSTAHQGGRLVHEQGIHALVGPSAGELATGRDAPAGASEAR